MEKIYLELLENAKEASRFSYSPYSKFAVGACVLYESGKKYVGCNVENASYGLSLCAERNAISSAIAHGEKSKIKAIAIYSPNQTKCAPCGACRQWMSEFCAEDGMKIILENDDKTPFVVSLEEIFPLGFSFKG